MGKGLLIRMGYSLECGFRDHAIDLVGSRFLGGGMMRKWLVPACGAWSIVCRISVSRGRAGGRGASVQG